jgi:hypothetical protein
MPPATTVTNPNSQSQNKQQVVAAGAVLSERWTFEQVRSIYELYSVIQVDSDTVYYYRTSIITLTEGLLLLAYQSFLSNAAETNGLLPAMAIGITGVLLSVLWFLFEQRNQIYFVARASVLRDVEQKLTVLATQTGVPMKAMWTAVPQYVRASAKLYQRASAPLIQKTIIPLMFVALWIVLVAFSPTLFSGSGNDSPDNKCLVAALSSNGGNFPAAAALCERLRD